MRRNDEHLDVVLRLVVDERPVLLEVVLVGVLHQQVKHLERQPLQQLLNPAGVLLQVPAVGLVELHPDRVTRVDDERPVGELELPQVRVARHRLEAEPESLGVALDQLPTLTTRAALSTNRHITGTVLGLTLTRTTAGSTRAGMSSSPIRPRTPGSR